MGAKITSAALLAMPYDLSHPAKVCLLVMSHIAHDSGRKPGLYWGGWQALALVLGYTEYDDRAERAVARAMAELTNAKLVEKWDVSEGHRVSYRLLPWVPGKWHITGYPKGGEPDTTVRYP